MRSLSHHQRLVCLLCRRPGSSLGSPLFGLAGLPSRGQLAEISAWSCRAAGDGATSCSFLGEVVVWVDVSVTAAGAGGVSGAGGRSQVALRW